MYSLIHKTRFNALAITVYILAVLATACVTYVGIALYKANVEIADLRTELNAVLDSQNKLMDVLEEQKNSQIELKKFICKVIEDGDCNGTKDK